MTDSRQRQLNAYASLCLRVLGAGMGSDLVCRATRSAIAREAANVGFRSDEIDAAVKEALEAAAS